MPAVPSWDAPTQFDLTNPYNGSMSFNIQTAEGIYLLRGPGCTFDIGVRNTKQNIPQFDGSILHKRFLTGAEVGLKIELWDNDGQPACDELLATMLDEVSGAFRSLKNAGDNEGRLTWEVAGKAPRMLEDIKLLGYPQYVSNPAEPVVNVRVDSQYPYAEQLEQFQTDIDDGNSAVLNNIGTAETFPVFKVYGTFSAFTLTVVHGSVSQQLVYSGTTITAPHYVEFNSLTNTAFLDGNSTDELPSVDIVSSLFPILDVGNSTVSITGADVSVLWNPAYG